MNLIDPPVQFDGHPLAGLSPEQRDDMRTQAFGRVLAAVATRKTGPQDREPASSDR